jgi:hypothetical protein
MAGGMQGDKKAPGASSSISRACFKNGHVKGHDLSRAEKDAKIEGF